MAVILHASQPDFDLRLREKLARGSDADFSLRETVADIIAQVRRDGDAALFELTKKFDRHQIDANSIRVSAEEIASAIAKCDPAAIEALRLATNRIRAYHEKQKPEDHQWTDAQGVTLGWRWTAIDAVGLYVPGGRAVYPSSVLMNAVPAKVAGVTRLAMTVPAPDGYLNPLVLAAASIAGIDEIYCIGGAQAVAALAYGTKTIAAVDKIVGPGNAYVAEAKRQVYGVVGIDSIAGPSEICVVADATISAEWIAADLLSQSEHDADAQSVLISDDEEFIAAVESHIQTMIANHPRKTIVEAAWRDHGVLIIAAKNETAKIVDYIAPEHLELAMDEPQELLAQIRHAGAIFVGRHTPEAIGDYVAGPDHVLPTSQTARFSSGLSLMDFMKRTSIASCTPQALQNIGPAAAILADAEGLPSHAASVLLRLRDK